MRNNKITKIKFGLSLALAAFLTSSVFADNTISYTSRMPISSGSSYEFETDSKFADCPIVYIYGSAIANYGTVSVADDVSLGFYSNAGVYGGAVYNSGIMDLGDSVVFDSNTSSDAKTSDGTLYYGVGGALMNVGTLTIGDYATFNENTASYLGGAIYNTSSLTIGKYATFTGNDSTYYGGAIINVGSGDIDIDDNALFEDNTGSYGGAIFSEKTLSIGDYAVFKENKATSVDGGAIYATSTTTIGKYAKFIDNSAADSGGAIFYSLTKGELVLDTATFEGNFTTAGSGGAIFLDRGLLTITNSSFDDNTSGVCGGAIASTTSYKTGDYEADREYWDSVENFDAITKVAISTSSFTNNTAAYDGGALAIYSDSVISSSLFENNTATGYGGAIYTGGWGRIDIDGSSFISNSSTTDYAGGAIATAPGGQTGDTYLKINNSYFEANTSTNIAGAIYTTFYTELIDTTFVNNTAKTQGGAIYYYYGSSTLSSGSTITIGSTIGNDIVNVGNSAASDADGGFLYIKGTSSYIATVIFDTEANSSITIGDGTAGYDSIASEDSYATINKTGSGTLTVNSSMEFFTGTLNVEAGTMEVNKNLGASTITIGSDSTTANLSLQVNTTPTLTSESLSTITVYDDSFLSLIASANLTAEQSYSISLNDSFSMDSTNVKTFGGTFNGSVFTVSAITDITIDDTGTQTATVTNYDRIAISTTSTSENATIVMSFSELTNSDTTIKSVSSDTVSLDSYLSDSSVVAEISDAFYFDVENLADGDSVVLSFLVDASALTSSDFTLYHKEDDGEWEVYDVDVTYDGQYLSFTVDGFSSYGYSAVPEPSTYAMIFGALALGLAVYRRRK